MTFRVALFAIVTAVVVAGTSSVAIAAWDPPGAGQAAAAAASMPSGAPPAGSATGSSVTVRWPAVTLTSGAAVAGYTINRFDALNGTQATVGAGCSGVVPTTTCTELSVPPGTWIYTDTPVQGNWMGGASSASGPISVP